MARPALKIIGRHGFNSHNNFCAGGSMKRPLLRCDSSLQTLPRCPIPPIPKRAAHAMHRLSETARLIIAAWPAC